MNIRMLAALAISLTLTGCMHTNIQQYSAIDQTQKTITVPLGSNGLKGALKKVLHEDGWIIKVDAGPRVRESAAAGALTVQKQYDTFNSRYRLQVNSSQYDTCIGLGFSPAIGYDISLVDNTTGAEVFTISGKDCQSAVISKFNQALRGGVTGR